jgi:signal transduction histidine kinase
MLRRPVMVWIMAGLLWALAGVLIVLRAGEPRDGVWVSVFYPRHPYAVVVATAATTPLQAGDLIVSIDGRPLNDWLMDAFSQPTYAPTIWQAGQTIHYQVQRGTAQFEVPLTLQPGGFDWPSSRWGAVLFALVFQLVAAFVFIKRPHEEAAVVLFLTAASGASYVVIKSLEVQVGEMIHGPRFWLFFLGGIITYTLFFVNCIHLALVFPQRHSIVLHRRWLISALYSASFGLVTIAAARHWPVSGDFFQWIHAQANFYVLGAGGALAATALLSATNYRACRDPIKRQQAKWVIYAIVISLTWSILTYYLPSALERVGVWTWPDNLLMLSFNLAWVVAIMCPLAFAIAILRYRLFDIDLLINRTLVYGTLTFFVIATYVFIVVLLGSVFEARGNLFFSLLATGLVAVLFQPVRERVQQRVNRWMYGDRDEPYVVLSRLGERLENTLASQAVLPTIVETVAHTLKLPYVAIALRENSSGELATAAAYGHESSIGQQAWPLTYQSDSIGQFIVTPRTPNATFTPAEQRLLADLARQTGLAAHAVQLTADLQRSRERLVTAREEERRRLRRDLHDGVGPMLAALGLKAGSLRHLIPADPGAAVVQAAELRDQIRGVIADIRRAVYDLRPPALDELGLIPALREQAAQYTAQGLHVIVEAPDPMPLLSAAVEVAVYRITLEALTNVARHAEARHCRISLSMNTMLNLTINDDGHGLPQLQRSGVGLVSMRERATELGGTFDVSSKPSGGTAIHVTLPLSLQATSSTRSEG